MRPLLNINNVARRLNRSPSQIRWMIHKGAAPKSALIGGRRMFREEDVEDWIAQFFTDPDNLDTPDTPDTDHPPRGNNGQPAET